MLYDYSIIFYLKQQALYAMQKSYFLYSLIYTRKLNAEKHRENKFALAVFNLN